jgi:hypothetical protein
MTFSVCMIVSDKGVLLYIGHQDGKFYEIIGFRNGQILLREIK